MNDKEIIEFWKDKQAIDIELLMNDLPKFIEIIENQKAEIEKKDRQIDLMAEDKYENINMLQMANIGKEINYDPTKLFNGIPDEEVIKIIKQYFENKAEEGK